MRTIRGPAVMVALVALTLAVLALPALAEKDDLVRLTVVFTNDIHGGIDRTGATFMSSEFPPPLGGGASAATYIEQLRERAKREGGYVLLMDQGDIFQGTPVGNYENGKAVVEFFNHIGLDLWTVGNHDFDEGYDNLWKLVELSDMPVLSANIVWADGDEPIDYLKPYIIKDYGGIKVAIIGLTTTDTPKMAFPAHVEPVAFLDEIKTARKYVKEVRDLGADLVFVSGHMGLPYDPEAGYAEMMQEEEEREAEPVREPLEESKWGPSAMEISHKVPGIDVFFGGHIHKGFDQPWEEPTTHTLHFQTYGRGTGIGVVDLLIDPKTKTLAGYELPDYRGSLITLFEDEWWPDAETAQMIEEKVAEAEQGMDRVIGEATVDLTRGGDGETRMGNLACDAMREEVSADFSFTNLGGIRDEIPAGPITPRQVFRVLPFGNSLEVFEMSGRLLKEVIEARVSDGHHGVYISGGKIIYSKSRPDYDRVTFFEIGGQTWDPDKIYKVVTTDFLAAGNSGLYMLPLIPDDERMRTSTTCMDAAVHYIERHSPIGDPKDGRWLRDDDSQMDPALAKAMEGMEPLTPPESTPEGSYD
jgi:5'-nucleotidase / UDP-sugar diphosphatase